MSNLGWYQIMTTMAKKVGGPLRLFGIVAGGGALIGGGAVAGGSAIKRKVEKELDSKKKIRAAAVIHTVQKEGSSNEGLKFNIGDKFKVLEIDGDAALIEKLEDENNPYFVSAKFLSSISDFKYLS